MPRYSNGTRWWREAEVCTTTTINPAVYELPAGMPEGVRVRLLEFRPGQWRVEREEQPGGSSWWVSMVLLEPDLIPGPPTPRWKPSRP